jgi:biopolymer transport protein ExbB
VGLFVAIPAVAAYNYFVRLVKNTLANTDALGHVLLSHLKSNGTLATAGASASPVAEPPPPSAPGKAKAKAKESKPAEEEAES